MKKSEKKLKKKAMRMNRRIGRLPNACQDAMGQGENRWDITEDVNQM